MQLFNQKVFIPTDMPLHVTLHMPLLSAIMFDICSVMVSFYCEIMLM